MAYQIVTELGWGKDERLWGWITDCDGATIEGFKTMPQFGSFLND